MIALTLRDRKWASWIREQNQVDDIIVQIKKKRLTLAGQVVRQTDKGEPQGQQNGHREMGLEVGEGY